MHFASMSSGEGREREGVVAAAGWLTFGGFGKVAACCCFSFCSFSSASVELPTTMTHPYGTSNSAG